MRALTPFFLRGNPLSAPARASCLSLLVTAAAASSAGCSQPIEQRECDQLLDRYTEFLMHDQEPDVAFEEVRRRQHEARAKASTSPEFATCSDRVTRRQYECAMQAPNADRLEQCLVF
ncbi:MAG: hypothetical protein KC766_16415 [Myxococcales bacterium]|nr:hypothetical protein [Myxococcales bacterium]